MSRPTALKTIRTDTLEIAYEENGETNGKPVVLLHGFPDDPRAWDGVVGPLTKDGFRTIVPYLRGFGPTRFLHADTLRSGQQAALAYDLNGLIEGLKLKQPILAGYDWGARAACTGAALWSAQVAGLVSIGGYNIEQIVKMYVAFTEGYRALKVKYPNETQAFRTEFDALIKKTLPPVGQQLFGGKMCESYCGAARDYCDGLEGIVRGPKKEMVKKWGDLTPFPVDMAYPIKKAHDK